MESGYPPQPEEGRLLARAATADGRSVRQLAMVAGMSDARWRHIVKGYQPTGGGRYTEVRAPASTLARMAFVLRIDPEELELADRKDAARELRALEEMRGSQRIDMESISVPTAINEPRSRHAAINDQIQMIAASKSMTAKEKLEAISTVIQLQAEAEAEEVASASGEATVTQPQVTNGS